MTQLHGPRVVCIIGLVLYDAICRNQEFEIQRCQMKLCSQCGLGHLYITIFVSPKQEPIDNFYSHSRVQHLKDWLFSFQRHFVHCAVKSRYLIKLNRANIKQHPAWAIDLVM